MSIEIIIDPNVRTEGNRTYGGFEDVRGGFVDDLSPGDQVTVVEEESDVIGEATVYQINPERRLVYLVVNWSSLRPRPRVVIDVSVPLVRAHYISAPAASELGTGATSGVGIRSLAVAGG